MNCQIMCVQNRILVISQNIFSFSHYIATKTFLLIHTISVQIRISFSHYFATKPLMQIRISFPTWCRKQKLSKIWFYISKGPLNIFQWSNIFDIEIQRFQTEIFSKGLSEKF